MNTTFEQNSNFNSKSRIYEGYFEESASRAGNIRRGLESFLYIIASILTAMTSAKAIALFKVIGVAGALVGFVGIIGAVEQGTLGMGAGLLLGTLLVGIEYLCLRPKRRDA
jgi:hypothetical protein